MISDSDGKRKFTYFKTRPRFGNPSKLIFCTLWVVDMSKFPARSLWSGRTHKYRLFLGNLTCFRPFLNFCKGLQANIRFDGPHSRKQWMMGLSSFCSLIIPYVSQSNPFSWSKTCVHSFCENWSTNQDFHEGLKMSSWEQKGHVELSLFSKGVWNSLDTL